MMQPDSYSDVDSGLACLERIGSTVVVTITVSELMGPVVALTLRDLLNDTRANGAVGMVIDLQNVQAIDSACVGALVEVLTMMREEGADGRIALVNAALSVTDLFRITKLDRVFPICRDTMTAIQIVEQSVKEEQPRRKFWKW